MGADTDARKYMILNYDYVKGILEKRAPFRSAHLEHAMVRRLPGDPVADGKWHDHIVNDKEHDPVVDGTAHDPIVDGTEHGLPYCAWQMVWVGWWLMVVALSWMLCCGATHCSSERPALSDRATCPIAAAVPWDAARHAHRVTLHASVVPSRMARDATL